MDIIAKAHEIVNDYNKELDIEDAYPSGMGLHSFIHRRMAANHSYNEMDAVEREAGKIIWPHLA